MMPYVTSNDKQKPDAAGKSLEHLEPALGGVRGIIVNRVSTSLLGGLYTSNHFYAIIPSAAAGEGKAAAVGKFYPIHH